MRHPGVRERDGLSVGVAPVAKIVVITQTPIFSDAGTHMRCELISNDERWVFFIPWDKTQMAIPACTEAVEAHMRRVCNVMPFGRAGADHG